MKETYTRIGKTFRFNDHVCFECVLAPDEKRTGRLVQVRVGVGDFGSDIYIARLRDGSLMSFSNVMIRKADDKKFEDAYYRSNGKEPPQIPPQDTYPSDSTDAEYSICDKWPETGFVIERPSQPESGRRSFAMTITTEGEITP